MPSRELVEQLLAQFPEVQMLTEVYQGAIPGVGRGVCRALVREWVEMIAQAQMTGDAALLANLRNKLQNLAANAAEFVKKMKLNDQFLALQDAATEKLQAEIASAKQQRQAAESTAEERARLLQHVKDLSAELHREHARLTSFMLGPSAQMQKGPQDQSLEGILSQITTLAPGFYLVVGNDHTVGFYIDPTGSPCLFLDPNTGELACRSPAELAAFMRAHMAAVYKNDYRGKPLRLSHGGAIVSPHTPSLLPPPAPTLLESASAWVGSFFGGGQSGLTRPALAGNPAVNGGRGGHRAPTPPRLSASRGTPPAGRGKH